MTPRQEGILAWLNKTSPHEGGLFETALRLWADSGMPCRARMIAHAYRELCSGLANINGQTSRTDLLGLIDKVARQMQGVGPVLEATPVSSADPSPQPRDSISVPRKVVQAVRELVDARLAQPKGVARAQALIDHMHSRRIDPDAEISPTATRWHRMTVTFQVCCHDRNSDDSTLIETLKLEVEFLEETLSSFAQGAVENLSALDDLLGQANS